MNFSSVFPRKVVDVAKRRGAKSIIIAHNHPGASLTPSGNDISAGEILSEFLRSAEIILEKSYVVWFPAWSVQKSFFNFKRGDMKCLFLAL